MKFGILLKVIGGMIATVLLGALGSGAWENIIGPLFSVAGRSSIQLASAIYSGYQDSLYERASHKLSGHYTPKIASLILMMWGLLLGYSCIKSRLEHSFARLPMGFRKFLKIYSLVLSLGLVGGSAFIMSASDYAQKIESYADTSLETLRPFIDEKSYFLLRLQFMQVDSEEKFKVFKEDIESRPLPDGVSLPQFELIE